MQSGVIYIFPCFGYVNGRVNILHGRVPLSSSGEKELERAAAALKAVDIPRVYVAGEVYALWKRSPRLPQAFAARLAAEDRVAAPWKSSTHDKSAS